MKKLRIILTGAKGQLGQSVCTAVREQFPEIELIATDREELDVCEQGSLEHFVYTQPSHLPTMLINCAAYTAVDRAEQEDEVAYALNSFAPGFLAHSCLAMDMMMIHISTDYVFDGRAERPYTEEDSINPLSVYGETKAVGEENVRRFLGLRSLVVRTSWLYSPYGRNFVKTMISLSHERDEISVVNDQIGCPTYAPHLAEALLRIALDAVERGYFVVNTLHYSNSGATTWYDLARHSIELMGRRDCLVKPITTAEYSGAVASRPMYSVLSHALLEKSYGITPPMWEEGLECMRRLQEGEPNK